MGKVQKDYANSSNSPPATIWKLTAGNKDWLEAAL